MNHRSAISSLLTKPQIHPKPIIAVASATYLAPLLRANQHNATASVDTTIGNRACQFSCVSA